MFKVVSKSNKITVYDAISQLKLSELTLIKELVSSINNPDQVRVHWDGLQVALEVVAPIISGTLKSLVERRTKNDTGPHYILVPILNKYLQDGFSGVVNFEMERGMTRDEATRKTAKFVYNVAKYQLVKYLGVFNVMYKFYISKTDNIKFEDITGVDRLLTKLEYNALTNIGRKISDYGVPEKVLKYYEEDKNPLIFANFDEYEKTFQNKIKYIISDEKER